MVTVCIEKLIHISEYLLPYHIKHGFRLVGHLNKCKKEWIVFQASIFQVRVVNFREHISRCFCSRKGRGFVGFLLKEAISQLMKMMPKEEVQRQ